MYKKKKKKKEEKAFVDNGVKNMKKWLEDVRIESTDWPSSGGKGIINAHLVFKKKIISETA